MAFRSPLLRSAVGLAAFLAAWAAGHAGENLPGPVAASLIRVVDGDTLEVKVRIWLGQELVTSVRIRGIDAPELHGRCRRETILAAAATDRLADLTGETLTLTAVGEDKYFGRVVADVTNQAGDDLGRLMLASGLARPYDGGQRGDWCGLVRLEQE